MTLYDFLEGHYKDFANFPAFVLTIIIGCICVPILYKIGVLEDIWKLLKSVLMGVKTLVVKEVKWIIENPVHDPNTAYERFDFYYDQHKIDTISLISFDAGIFYYPVPNVPGYQASKLEYEFAKKIIQLLHNGDLSNFKTHEREFGLKVVDKSVNGWVK